MRLPLIDPADLSPEQRPVYDDMRAGIEKNFRGFKSIAENGALMGPWNPWLHDPPEPHFIQHMSFTPTSSPPNGVGCPTTSSLSSPPASGRTTSHAKRQ